MLPSVTQPSAAYVSLQYLVCGHLQGNLRDTVLVTYAVPHAETRKNLTYRIVGAPGPSSFGPGGAFEDKFKESRKDRSSSPPPPPTTSDSDVGAVEACEAYTWRPQARDTSIKSLKEDACAPCAELVKLTRPLAVAPDGHFLTWPLQSIADVSNFELCGSGACSNSELKASSLTSPAFLRQLSAMQIFVKTLMLSCNSCHYEAKRGRALGAEHPRLLQNDRVCPTSPLQDCSGSNPRSSREKPAVRLLRSGLARPSPWMSRSSA